MNCLYMYMQLLLNHCTKFHKTVWVFIGHKFNGFASNPENRKSRGPIFKKFQIVYICPKNKRGILKSARCASSDLHEY